MGTKQRNVNPWGLTFAEVDVMDLLCSVDSREEIAKRLHLTGRHNVDTHVCRARDKMAVNSTALAAVMWDRWRRNEGRGVPA